MKPVVEIPAFVPPLIVKSLRTQFVAAGYQPSEAKRSAEAAIPGVLEALQHQIDGRANALQQGESLVIDWDKAADIRLEIRRPAKVATVAAVPAAPVATKSVGLDQAQLAAIVSAVASAAAQGAAAGAHAVAPKGDLIVKHPDGRETRVSRG